MSEAAGGPRTGTAQAPAELLKNPGFEGEHTGTAPGWRPNSWGTPAPKARFSPDGEEAHGGQRAQRFQVDAEPGRVHLTQAHRFTGGRTYRASIWVKAVSPVSVTLQMRSDDFKKDFYQAFAVHTTRAGTGWQQIEATGTAPHDMSGSFRIFLGGTGTVLVDDASLTEVSSSGTPDLLPAEGPVPADYFGMHMLCRGCYGNSWPSIGFGLWRMWDNGVRWRDLEPRKGKWNFKMMNYFMKSAADNDVSVLYTLGSPPSWAASNQKAGAYGPGSAAMPKDIEDWRRYVREVATRYKGRIQMYEMWNEPDYAKFWNGTPAQLAELTRVAAEEIGKADPAAKIVSPGITTNGLNWLDAYFAAGAGKHVDVVGSHIYFGLRPEGVLPRIRNVRKIMKAHGLGGLPLRVTEGAPMGRTSVSGPAEGAASRALALFWAYGVSGFDWYTWDRHGDQVLDLAEPDNRTPSRVGRAYARTVGWLRGARMTGHTVDGAGTHVVTLARSGGYTAQMVWNERAVTTFKVPSGWRVERWAPLTGKPRTSSPTVVNVGGKPVFMESGIRP
ncbi:carbohydrate binding domain-containing protein [Planomonospora sp. ID67723]|uniref:GH39 family glycosyl hydrolase n=1 Tax=Planomonospora sp. ID67723 TaxID=2738134 RepID=UPI0018C3FB0F|nr:carbohydrate binding domain-containing protein [Planomonospora sp. ID67723]MBG0832173.1 carbohydrate binding domain-containing protein [Planomonospora sp. ID67723]